MAPLYVSLTNIKIIVNIKVRKTNFFFIFSENLNMTTITGVTVTEMMEKSKKSRSAVEMWLSRHPYEPIIKELLYPEEALKKLLESKIGRPVKQQSSEAPKKPRKSRKGDKR